MNIIATLVDCQQSVIMARVIEGNYNYVLKTISYLDVLRDSNKEEMGLG